MRYIAITRAAYGALLLLAPGAVTRVASGGSSDRATALMWRVLGFRHLAQALILDRAGTRSRLLTGAATDATHALSMLGLAALNEDRRWPAVLDAALATGLAVNGVWEARDA